MKKEMNIKDELLKQMGPAPDKGTTRQILERDACRVRRMKWLNIVFWSVVGAAYVGGALLELALKQEAISEGYAILMSFLIAISHILTPFGLIFLISYWLRSRSLTIRQIQARLAGIEKQLRELAQIKSPAQEVDGPTLDH